MGGHQAAARFWKPDWVASPIGCRLRLVLTVAILLNITTSADGTATLSCSLLNLAITLYATTSQRITRSLSTTTSESEITMSGTEIILLARVMGGASVGIIIGFYITMQMEIILE